MSRPPKRRLDLQIREEMPLIRPQTSSPLDLRQFIAHLIPDIYAVPAPMIKRVL
jgi:hypothetical protein